MFRIALIIALSAALAASAGQVYKWVDEDGNVQYSDQPPPQGHVPHEHREESPPAALSSESGAKTSTRLTRTSLMPEPHNSGRRNRLPVGPPEHRQIQLKSAFACATRKSQAGSLHATNLHANGSRTK